jgi:hypothetical protein
VEAAISIEGDQLLALVGPGGADPPAPDDAAGFDLENVGEIAPQRQFQIEVHRVPPVIGHFETLVHAPVDDAGHH